jgi:alpha-L-arabinofuranosidase
MAVRVESEESSPLNLSVSASKSDKELVVTMVNPRHDVDLQVECTLKGTGASGCSAQILHDGEWNACNTFDNPERVTPRLLPTRIDGSKLVLDLPRLSVATAVVQIH